MFLQDVKQKSKHNAHNWHGLNLSKKHMYNILEVAVSC